MFGCAGAVLSVGLGAPQAWTSCVRRRVAGLSPAARWTAVAQSASWLAYGLVERVPLQLLTNAACLLLHLSVLTALLVLDPAARAGRLAAAQGATTVAWLAVVAVCAVTGSMPVATLAAVVGAVSVVPQLWWLARSRGADTSGVSVTTTALSLAASLCWTTHGLALAQPAVVLPGLAGAVAAAWTLALLRPPVAPRRVRRQVLALDLRRAQAA